jgi:hypothetical protein
MRTCNGIHPTGTVSHQAVLEYDAKLKQMLEAKYNTKQLDVWHRMWSVIGKVVK